MRQNWNHLKKRKLWILAFVFSFVATSLFAQDRGYDPYAPVYPKELKAKRFFKDPLSTLIALPFEIVKWPVDQALLYIEKHKLDKKAIWIYEDVLRDNGIKPYFKPIGLTRRSYGSKFDFISMSQQRHNLPDVLADAWIHYGDDIHFTVGSQLGLERIAGTGLHTSGYFQYDRRWQEHFYGIGPDTSAGDGANYGTEKTKIGGTLGYEFMPQLDFTTGFFYNNMNIFKGEDTGRHQIKNIVEGQFIPGLRGDEYVTLQAELTRDTRDFKERPTKGSYQTVHFSFNEGVDDSPISYFKYKVDMAKYFSLGSPKRVLAIRAYGEHHDEINGREIPFYNMARLGGYGTYPRPSQTLRAFDFNRFFDESSLLFNIEYRYAIWEYRDFKLDTVFFLDEGQVFGEFSKMKLEDFRESYGIEFRLTLANYNLINFSIAHGDEGTNFYVRSKTSF